MKNLRHVRFLHFGRERGQSVLQTAYSASHVLPGSANPGQTDRLVSDKTFQNATSVPRSFYASGFSLASNWNFVSKDSKSQAREDTVSLRFVGSEREPPFRGILEELLLALLAAEHTYATSPEALGDLPPAEAWSNR